MSYWDFLPPEIQEYVLKLRESQALIDHRNNHLVIHLCNEIKIYGRLCEKWQIGHIEVRPKFKFIVKRCKCQGPWHLF